MNKSVGLILMLLSINCYASMNIYPMEAQVTQNGVSELQVSSKSTDVQFIKVIEKKIINTGTKDEKEVSVDMASGDGLTITPQKLALTAGGTRIVRLISLKPPVQETTWRVYFEGVTENKFNNIKVTGKEAASVGINIVWGVLVHVAPEHVSVDLKYNTDDNSISNNGTIRTEINEIAECSKDSECLWTKYRVNIYPGTRIKNKSFHFKPGGVYKVKFYNWISGKNEEVTLHA
ncbi:fimbrial protein [Pantoea stewartii]|uniref:fimbrial protein n=1 Tax=Pantoea stewartii TaxID=66269 RepID=UPI0015627D7A|nr:fimbrial protein [Pantoea stewartii]